MFERDKLNEQINNFKYFIVSMFLCNISMCLHIYGAKSLSNAFISLNKLFVDVVN